MHNQCFTQKGIVLHLLQSHNLKKKEQAFLQEEAFNQVATDYEDVIQPPNGSSEILQLKTYPGYQCHIQNCDFQSINKEWIRQHYS